MEIKILAFGKNERFVNDICDQIKREKGIPVERNPVLQSSYGVKSMNNVPHMVIICMEDEIRFEIKKYDVFDRVVRDGKTKVVVIANDKDKSNFREATGLSQVMFLPKLVNMQMIYAKIDEIREQLKKKNVVEIPVMEEYVNPNPQDEFRRRHILVVDDDPEQLYQIKEHLKEFYDVTVVASGRAAIKYLENHKVDLVLLDFIMPGMDGTMVLSRMKLTPELKDIPVIFLTGVSDKEKVMRVIRDLSPQGYMLKPAKKSELVAAIIEVLG